MYKGGYKGKILRVNLSKNEIKIEPLSKELVRNYIGGSGFAAKILYDEVGPEIDPLSPDNELILATGPLTGTLWPTTGRIMFASKSPLTEIGGESHVGGFLGPELKFAGYDMIIVKGKAKSPVYLYIEDDIVELRDAKHLWGSDTHETTKIIQEENGDPEIQVAAIGPAGENLVLYACIIINLARAAGRTGMGAVMGSKNLKAIAVRGTGTVEVADFEKFMELAEEAHERIDKNPQAREMTKYGTPLLVAYKQEIGELPTRNHQTGVFNEWEKLSAETLRENYWVKTRACFGCSIACKKAFKVTEGPYAGTFSEGPEYEGLYAFGTNCGNPDFGSILKANLLCNKYGIDIISAGATIAFMMELYEKGIISREDVEGLNFTWGNHELIVELLPKIAHREGIGNLLAEGTYRIAKKIGKNAEKYAIQVKKLEMSGQDGRTHRSIALGHATAARGADHLRSLITVDQLGYEEIAKQRFGEDKLPEICNPYTEKYKAYATKITEDVYAIRDALIVCWYSCAWPPIFWIEDFAQILPIATGIKEFGSIEELYKIGERQVTLKRAFNVREGIRRKDDTLPERFLKEPMPEGPGRGQVVNLDVMLDEYYELRGWNKETGIPTKEKLKELGLNFVINDFEKRGIL